MTDGEAAAPSRPVTANPRAFRVLVRNAMFRRVELAAPGRYAALGELDATRLGRRRLGRRLDPLFEEHAELPTHADARGPGLFVVTEEPGRWVVRQIIDDPEGHHDWGIGATVDLAASDEAGTAVVTVTAVDRL